VILLDWHGLIFEILWLKHLLSLFNAFIYRQKMMPRLELCDYLTCEAQESVVKIISSQTHMSMWETKAHV
jgi:hypothetical protein